MQCAEQPKEASTQSAWLAAALQVSIDAHPG